MRFILRFMHFAAEWIYDILKKFTSIAKKSARAPKTKTTFQSVILKSPFAPTVIIDSSGEDEEFEKTDDETSNFIPDIKFEIFLHSAFMPFAICIPVWDISVFIFASIASVFLESFLSVNLLLFFAKDK